jgi:hypothetical protein
VPSAPFRTPHSPFRNQLGVGANYKDRLNLNTAVEMAAKEHKEHKENRVQGKWMSWTHLSGEEKSQPSFHFPYFQSVQIRAIRVKASPFFCPEIFLPKSAVR